MVLPYSRLFHNNLGIAVILLWGRFTFSVMEGNGSVFLCASSDVKTYQWRPSLLNKGDGALLVPTTKHGREFWSSPVRVLIYWRHFFRVESFHRRQASSVYRWPLRDAGLLLHLHLLSFLSLVWEKGTVKSFFCCFPPLSLSVFESLVPPISFV